jgi:hypothetical protein
MDNLYRIAGLKPGYSLWKWIPGSPSLEDKNLGEQPEARPGLTGVGKGGTLPLSVQHFHHGFGISGPRCHAERENGAQFL